MPRALRIETNEGIYHVYNRGNYRSFIFEDEATKSAFEKCLLEACERFGWELMAYCILGNHFHLCIATPRGNLSDGMQWLQGTFGVRYNRYRGESGHLFTGRFKSLIVEPGKHLSALVDYIHLNPARAELVEPARAGDYRWSSMYWFPKKKMRPELLDASWLDYRDGIVDSAAGWKRYAAFLQLQLCDTSTDLTALEKQMCRGWCLGEKDFKQAHVKEFLAKKETLRLEKGGLADLNKSHWQAALTQCLNKLGMSRISAEESAKSAPWKLAIAAKLRASTSVSNKWLSRELHMGVARGVSSNLCVYAKRRKRCPHYRKLKDLTFDV